VVLKAATVTKLTRNLFLAVVVPMLAFLHLKQQSRQEGGIKVDFAKLLPAFVLGFIAMAVLRSIGDATLQHSGAALGLWTAAQWEGITKSIGEFWGSRLLLGTAMAAVGLNTHPSVFKGVGAKPFAVGFAGSTLRRSRRFLVGGDHRSVRPIVTGDLALQPTRSPFTLIGCLNGVGH
jgi:uncharacterized membrane protein YadS